jgi:hypothetical protein
LNVVSILTVWLNCPTVVAAEVKDVGPAMILAKREVKEYWMDFRNRFTLIESVLVRADGLRIVVRTLWKLFYRQQIKYTRGTRLMFVARAVVCATAATGGGNGIRCNRDDIVFCIHFPCLLVLFSSCWNKHQIQRLIHQMDIYLFGRIVSIAAKTSADELENEK